MTEDELHKKRAELREALQNDASPQLRPQRSNSRSSNTAASTVAAALVAANSAAAAASARLSISEAHRGLLVEGPPSSNSENASATSAAAGIEATAIQHYKFKKYDRCHSLPKMDVKSPARIIEQTNEKSCENSSRSSRSATPPISASGLLVTSTPNAIDDTSNNTNDSLPMKSLHLRRRSGTPASVRSRVSRPKTSINLL